MRCSAYEGCQSRCGVADSFSFLKSFLVFLSRFFLRLFSLGPQGAVSSFVPGGVPVTSSYSSIRSVAKPMMSCLTRETAVGGTRPI